jgi:hypothetical protein
LNKQKKRRSKMTTTISRISLVGLASWAYRLMLIALVALLAWLMFSKLKLNFASVTLLAALGALTATLAHARRAARERFIAEADIPQFLKTKLRQTYPHLSGVDADVAEQGLREFFIACLHSKRQFMAMPSQAVDVLWHEFILHTQAYDQWCGQALGYFLHHTPAEALGKSAKRNDGLRRIWHWACKREGIEPRTPSHLPFLFAIDNRLRIPDGFHYAPDCRLAAGKVEDQKSGGCGGDVHCGTSFSDGSYSGGSADFGGAEAGGDGGGDGSGCGGGCGGGD